MTTVVDASALVAVLVDSGEEGKWAEATFAEGELARSGVGSGRGQQYPAPAGAE